MRRSQFIAALVVVAAIGGMVLARFGGDDTEAAEPAAIQGGEQASTSSDGDDQAEPSSSSSPADEETAAPLVVAEPPPVLDPKPELTGLDGWLQSDATDLSSFDGQVRIVQFWTFGCHNCKATLPHLQEIYARHQDDGLEIIGVHAPEFSFEAEVDNIAEAAVDLGVTWPIALDTDKTNFRAWQGSRRFWPRTYVLDQQGQVRFDHIGEGKYDELAETVEYLLTEGS